MTVSNTFVGLITVLPVALGFIADLMGVAWLIGFRLFALLMIGGIVTALTPPKAENMVIINN